MFNPLKKLFNKPLKNVPKVADDASAKRQVGTTSPIQSAARPPFRRTSSAYPYRRRVIRHTLRRSPSPHAQTVYAFIDSQNLNLGVLSQGGKLDFRKFREYLKLTHNVSKAFLFIGYVEENKVLYDYLKRSGYICVFKKVIEYKDKDIATKGNIDADLVLHTMIEYPHYDKAI
ncbi:MAG: hypothetical protein NTV98_03475, partial [Candidatus Roizmanbacteria bacterium]|nr:hypothetical protein [Candidatus Roizmanbacteria bacterium]